MGEEIEVAIKAVDQTMGGVRSASSGLGKLGKAGSASLGGLGKAAKLASLAIGGIALVAVGIAAKLAKDFLEAGDVLDKMSKSTGFTVEQLSALEFAAEQSGTSLDVVTKASTKFARIIEEAGAGTQGAVDTLDALGLSYEELIKLSPNEQLLAIADAMAGIENPTTRAALAQEALGRSGLELLPLLNDGAAGITVLTDRAEELGRVMSTDTATDVAEFNDLMNELKSELSGVALEGFVILLPALRKVVDFLVRDGVPAFRSTIDFATGLGDTLGTANKKVQEFGQLFKNTIEFVIIPSIELMRTIVATTLIGRLNSLVNLVQNRVVPNLEVLGETIGDRFAMQAGMAGGATDELLGKWNELGDELTTDLIPATDEFGNNTLNTVTAAFVTLVSTVGNAVLPILKEIVGFIKTFVVPVFQFFAEQGLMLITDVWENSLKPTFDELVETWEKVIGPALTKLQGFFQQTFEAPDGIGPVVIGVIEYIRSTIEIVMDVIGLIIRTVLNVIQGDWTDAWTDVQDTFTRIWDRISESFRGPVNAIILLAEGMANAVIGSINGIIRAWNDLQFSVGGTTIDLPFGKSFRIPSVTLGTPNIPLVPNVSIPRLQAGGIVRSPTLALIGEAGPEAVIPLGRGGAGATYNITINAGTIADERQVKDFIVRSITEAQTLGAVA